MAMRVRLHTTPVGMCFRIVSLVILGGFALAVTQQTDWYKTNVETQQQQPAAVAQPVPAPAPVPVAAAAPATAVHHSAPYPAAGTTPPGWTNFMGILIPPPGYNDAPMH